MTTITFHKRLRDMRDAAIRQAKYRPVYAHALTIAHMDGRLVATDHPAWARIDAAIIALRNGDGTAIDTTALDTLEREITRLREK